MFFEPMIVAWPRYDKTAWPNISAQLFAILYAFLAKKKTKKLVGGEK